MPPDDVTFLRQAVELARQAEQQGNLPIGAVIALDGQVIASGMNTIWRPSLALTRHAETEALRNLPPGWETRCADLTLYTTLEPCPMCAGAILLHQIGRVVFGAFDPTGGAGPCLGRLPAYFREVMARTEWTGPALPEECDPLYERVMKLERENHAHPLD